MPRTVELGTSIATRGISRVDPLSGVGRASRGYVSAGVTEDPSDLDPVPLLSTEAFDENGIQRLLSNNIVDSRYVEVYRSLFWHPDREYTGYAANGYWYTNGVRDPAHIPIKASWASEGEEDASANRGNLDRFPERIFVVTTLREVCIFDADNLMVWMRFALSQSGSGAFLGVSSTEIRSATFINGYLVVVTDAGLRIANFRADECYSYAAATTLKALTGISDRNETDFTTGATSIAHATRQLSSNNIYHVDGAEISIPDGVNKHNTTVCAIGHALGFDGITLAGDGITYPKVKKNQIARSFTNDWSIQDDEDGDLRSPYFVDIGTSWTGFSVSEGDILVTDTGLSLTITEVDQTVPGNRLVVSPEVLLSASGSTYSIRREVRRVHVSSGGHVYLTNGHNLITHVDTADWYDSAGSAVFSSLSTTFDTARLTAIVEESNDLAVTASGDVYVATSSGVFYISASDLEDGRDAAFLYATTSSTSTAALYKVLVGEGEECPAVAVDPETGNVLVAVNEYEGLRLSRSIITEVNANIHKAFRHFDNVGIVHSLLAYRNPDGPPDVEV